MVVSVGGLADTRCIAYAFQDGKALDVALFLRDMQVGIDVSVVLPTAPSHVSRGLSPGACCRAREDAKAFRYQEEVESWNAGDLSFAPFVMEAFGAFGEDAVQICKQIAEAAADSETSGWSRVEAMLACAAATSVAMLKGNAYIVRSCAMYARRAAFVGGPGRPIGAGDARPRARGSGRPPLRRPLAGT